MGFWPTKYHTPPLPRGATRYYSVPRDRVTLVPPPLRLPTALGCSTSDSSGYPLAINRSTGSLPRNEFACRAGGCDPSGNRPRRESFGAGIAIPDLELPTLTGPCGSARLGTGPCNPTPISLSRDQTPVLWPSSPHLTMVEAPFRGDLGLHG